MRNRWVLAATFVLVALGLLLCAEKESLAKQPARVPDPARPATPQRSAGHGPASLRAEQPVRSRPRTVVSRRGPLDDCPPETGRSRTGGRALN